MHRTVGFLGSYRPGLLAVGLTLAGALTVQAQNNSWTNTGDGFWQDATNWSAGAPSITQSALLITNAGTKTATIDGTTTNFPGTLTISNLTVTAPVGSANTLSIDGIGSAVPFVVLSNLTVNARGVLTVAGSAVNVGNNTLVGAAAGVASFHLTGGSFTNSGDVTIGSATGASGTWIINGGAHRIGANLGIGSASGNAGSAGTTGLVVISDSQLSVGGNIQISAIGTPAVLINSNSALSAGIVIVGFTGTRNGLFLVAGGTNTFTDELRVGDRGNSTGTVVVTGGTMYLTNSSGTGIVLGRSGFGNLTISNGFVSALDAIVGSYRAVGAEPGGVGLLTIAGGTQQVLRTLYAGSGTNTSIGTIEVSGGVLDAGSGTIVLGRHGTGLLSVATGTVLANKLLAGTNLLSQGILTLTGGSLFVTNAAGTATTDVRRATFQLESGALAVLDRLVMTNGSSSVALFNGGTLSAKQITVANNSTFLVGDGVSAATLNLLGGAHSFADGLTLNTNATLDGPGFSVLTMAGDLALFSNSTFVVDLSTNSVTPGTGYDRAFVTGLVSVADSILSLNLTNFTAVKGANFTIVDNDLSDAVIGAFAGLPQGIEFLSGGQEFKINYLGGTGNDIVLTVVPEPSALALFSLSAIAVGFIRRARIR